MKVKAKEDRIAKVESKHFQSHYRVSLEPSFFHLRKFQTEVEPIVNWMKLIFFDKMRFKGYMKKSRVFLRTS